MYFVARSGVKEVGVRLRELSGVGEGSGVEVGEGVGEGTIVAVGDGSTTGEGAMVGTTVALGGAMEGSTAGKIPDGVFTT